MGTASLRTTGAGLVGQAVRGGSRQFVGVPGDDALRGTDLGDHVLAQREILMAAAILDVQQHAPEEIGRETAPQDHDQHGQVLPQVRPAVLGQTRLGQLGNRLAGRQAVGERGTHHAGKRGHQNALHETELLDRRLLLLGSQLPLLRHAGQAAHARSRPGRPPRPGGSPARRSDAGCPRSGHRKSAASACRTRRSSPTPRPSPARSPGTAW